MSSIAADSSPWAGAPARRSLALEMTTGSLPIPLIPSAVARRLAGSTVSTSTRLSSVVARAIASDALSVVLPTPPPPQHTTTEARKVPVGVSTETQGP